MGFFDDDDDEQQVGLGAQLLGRLSQPGGLGASLLHPATLAPAAAGDDTMGAAAVQAPPMPTRPAAASNPRLTDANVQLLARMLTSECQGVCNDAEKQGVGSVAINRMNRRGTNNAADVIKEGQFSLKKDPDAESLVLARRLLSGELGDNTGNATNFYSPRSMPKEGESTKNSDVGPNPQLELVEGQKGPPARTYMPSFAPKLKQRLVPGARDWHVKFLGPPQP